MRARIFIVLDTLEALFLGEDQKAQFRRFWNQGSCPGNEELDALIKHLKPEVDAGHGPILHKELRLLLNTAGVPLTPLFRVSDMSESKTRHRQYRLVLKREDGYKEYTTVWLPEKHKGKKVEVGTRLTLEGNPDIWTVESMSEETKSAKAVREQARRHAKWREATDI